MPRNVEIKARVKNLPEVQRVASELSGTPGQVIGQRDVFFNVQKGRLKLRCLQGTDSQLIFYDRSDQEGPKLSDYNISLIPDPDQLTATLGSAIGIRGEVVKERILYLVGQTRIHCDKVQGLGDFVELEVVLEESQSLEEGVDIANKLMDKLSVKQYDLISGAYIDLIEMSNTK